MMKIHETRPRTRKAAPGRIACLLVLLLLVSAQPGLAKETGRHFLWAAQGRTNTVYFLGSIHLLKSNAYPLADAIEQVYRDSQVVAFEADMEAMTNPEFQSKMLLAGVYSDGQTLKQNVSADTYDMFQGKMEEIGLPAEQFSRFKPWLCAMTIGVVALQRLGFDPSYGIDVHFFSKAKKDGKQIDFFEPADYQLGLFTAMDSREQEAFLRQTLRDLEVIEEMADEMVASWKTGDAKQLQSLMSISFKEYPEIYERLVTRRNSEWMSKLKNLLNLDKNVLVIVGAGHLVGSESVLEMLRKQGVSIEQR
jgi:hypothetical protein